MQVARLLEGKHERTGGGKLRQIVRALQLEAQSLQGRDPAPLPAARAVRRQYRGRARGFARPISARSRAAFRRRSRPVGRAAAIAREPPPGPQHRGSPPRPRPRLARSRRGRRDHRRRGRTRAKQEPVRAPRVPQARPASGRGRGLARARQDRAPAHHRPRPSKRARNCSPPSRPSARTETIRRRHSPSTTPPAKCSPTSARPAISTTAASAPSTWPTRVRSPGLDAETLHLRPRLRSRPRASRNPDRGPPGALRHLRARRTSTRISTAR